MFVADAPTTTTQRLKALATGGLPSFFDVSNSFTAGELQEDNLLGQLAGAGRRLVRGPAAREGAEVRGLGVRGACTSAHCSEGFAVAGCRLPAASAPQPPVVTHEASVYGTPRTAFPRPPVPGLPRGHHLGAAVPAPVGLVPPLSLLQRQRFAHRYACWRPGHGAVLPGELQAGQAVPSRGQRKGAARERANPSGQRISGHTEPHRQTLTA